MPRRPLLPPDKPTSVELDEDVREYIRQCVEGGRSTIKWIINDAVRSRIHADSAAQTKSSLRKRPVNPLPA